MLVVLPLCWSLDVLNGHLKVLRGIRVHRGQLAGMEHDCLLREVLQHVALGNEVVGEDLVRQAVLQVIDQDQQKVGSVILLQQIVGILHR